jgi:hypothetical protein
MFVIRARIKQLIKASDCNQMKFNPLHGPIIRGDNVFSGKK